MNSVGRVAVHDLQARLHPRRQAGEIEVRDMRDVGERARSVGVPRTLTPSITSMSSGDASSRWAATAAPLRGAPAPRPGPRRRGSGRCGCRRCRTRRASRSCRLGARSTSSSGRRGTRSPAARSWSRCPGRAIPSPGTRRRCRRVGRGGAQARCVHAHHGLRLDVQPDADAHEPTGGELLALPDAERVVVDHAAACSSVSSGDTSTSGRPSGNVYGSSSRWITLRRRRSSGSMPICRASTSTACSRK